VAAALAAAEAGGSAPVRADVSTACGLALLLIGEPARAGELLQAGIELNHQCGQLVTLPDAVSLLGVARLRCGGQQAAQGLLAAGASWRRRQGLAILGRHASQLITDAEREVGLGDGARIGASSRAADSDSPGSGDSIETGAEAFALAGAVPFGRTDLLLGVEGQHPIVLL
jgi:hypothetical protein